MTGYSQAPLVKKLGLKPAQRIAIVGAPKDFSRELEPLPPGVEIIGQKVTKPLDFILFFVETAKALQKEMPQLKKNLVSNGMLWVAWPKKSSGMATDLSFALVQRAGLNVGLVDVKICAINEIWSGLKFVYRLTDRK